MPGGAEERAEDRAAAHLGRVGAAAQKGHAKGFLGPPLGFECPVRFTSPLGFLVIADVLTRKFASRVLFWRVGFDAICDCFFAT